MNGSENSYAGALFFALVSLMAVLKVEDFIVGCGIGVFGAFLAAISFRRALNKSAQAKEEDYQRMEVQFQQLRSKINETSSASVTAMNSLNDAAQLLKENLQIIHSSLKGLDKLNVLSKNIESISASVASLEENSAAFNACLERIFVAVESQEKPFTAEEFKNLIAFEEANKNALQTVLKILHFLAQTINNSSYVQELEKINLSFELLLKRTVVFEDLKISATDVQKNLLTLIKINSGLSKDFTKTLDNAQKNLSESIKAGSGLLKDFTTALDDTQKNLSELVKNNDEISKDFTATLDDLRLNVAQFSDKLDSLIDSSKEHNLTEEDIDLLKKIMSKINTK